MCGYAVSPVRSNTCIAAVLSGAFGGLLAGGITGGLNDAHGIAGWRVSLKYISFGHSLT